MSSPVAVGKRSEATRRLIDLLGAMNVGDSVPWETIESVAGVVGRPYSLVRSAERALENERKMHFRVVKELGVERISFNEVAREVVPSMRKRIVGAARRMERTTTNVVLTEMDADARTQVILLQTQAKMAQAVCSDKVLKKLQAASEASPMVVAPMSPKAAMALVIGE